MDIVNEDLVAGIEKRAAEMGIEGEQRDQFRKLAIATLRAGAISAARMPEEQRKTAAEDTEVDKLLQKAAQESPMEGMGDKLRDLISNNPRVAAMLASMLGGGGLGAGAAGIAGGSPTMGGLAGGTAGGLGALLGMPGEAQGAENEEDEEPPGLDTLGLSL